MPTSTQDLQSFQQYAATRIQNGGAKLELDDLLDEWKHQNPDPQQLQQDALAVKASLRDLERGETGTPAETVIADLKAKYNLTTESCRSFESESFPLQLAIWTGFSAGHTNGS